MVFGLFLILLSTTLFLLPRGEGIGVKLERLFSAKERIANWSQAVTIFSRYPITGVGFNTLRYARRQFSLLPEDWLDNHAAAGVDNSFLFVLVTTGIIGLMTFLAALFQFFRKSSLIFRISLIGVVVHSFFLNSFFFPWIMFWLWILLGISDF